MAYFKHVRDWGNGTFSCMWMTGSGIFMHVNGGNGIFMHGNGIFMHVNDRKWHIHACEWLEMVHFMYVSNRKCLVSCVNNGGNDMFPVCDWWNLTNRKCYISCICQVAVHATCLFIGQLQETVQEMVPYPIAGHVQETCDFPEEGSLQDSLQDVWSILNLSWNRKHNLFCSEKIMQNKPKGYWKKMGVFGVVTYSR